MTALSPWAALSDLRYPGAGWTWKPPYISDTLKSTASAGDSSIVLTGRGTGVRTFAPDMLIQVGYTQGCTNQTLQIAAVSGSDGAGWTVTFAGGAVLAAGAVAGTLVIRVINRPLLLATTTHLLKTSTGRVLDVPGPRSITVPLGDAGDAAPALMQVLAIDSGGAGSTPYVADEMFSGGSTFSTGATIDTSGVTNPAPMSVYQNDRFDTSFTYTLTGLTPTTAYTVRLHFAEIFFTGAGSRQFNVAINSVSVLTNYDIYAAAGAANKAITPSFSVASDGSGQIIIAFTSGAFNVPIINGIEVLGAGGATPGFAQAMLAAIGGAGITDAPVPTLCEYSFDGGATIIGRFLVENAVPNFDAGTLTLTGSSDDIGTLLGTQMPNHYTVTDVSLADALGGTKGQIQPLQAEHYGISTNNKLQAVEGLLVPLPGNDPPAMPMWDPGAQARIAMVGVISNALSSAIAFLSISCDSIEDPVPRIIQSLLLLVGGFVFAGSSEQQGSLGHAVYCDADINLSATIEGVVCDGTPTPPMTSPGPAGTYGYSNDATNHPNGIPRALVIGNVGGSPSPSGTALLDGTSTDPVEPDDEANVLRIMAGKTTVTPDLTNLFSEVQLVGGTSDAGLPSSSTITSVVTLNNSPTDLPPVAVTNILPLIGVSVQDATGGVFLTLGNGRFILVPSWTLALPVYDLTVDNTSGLIYAATSQGVYRHSTRNIMASPLTNGAAAANSYGTSSGSNSSTTLNDTTKAWLTDQWAQLLVLIRTGTGVGQIRTVVSNTATALTVDAAWSITPDATSTYSVLLAPWEKVGTLSYKITQLSGLVVSGTGFYCYALVSGVGDSQDGIYQHDDASPSTANGNVGYLGWERMLRMANNPSFAATSDADLFFITPSDKLAALWHYNANDSATPHGTWPFATGVTGVRVDRVLTAAGQDSIWVAVAGGAQSAYYVLKGTDWSGLTLLPADRNAGLGSDGALDVAVQAATGLQVQPQINRAVALGYGVGPTGLQVTVSVALCTSLGVYILTGSIPSSNGGNTWSPAANGQNGLAGLSINNLVSGALTNVPDPDDPTALVGSNRMYAIANNAFYVTYSSADYWLDLLKEPVTWGPVFYDLTDDGQPSYQLQTIGGMASSPLGASSDTHLQVAGVFPDGWYMRRRWNSRLEPFYGVVNSAVQFPYIYTEPITECVVDVSTDLDTASAYLLAVGFLLLGEHSTKLTTITAQYTFSQQEAFALNTWPTHEVKMSQQGIIKQVSSDGETLVDTTYIDLDETPLKVTGHTIDSEGTLFTATTTLAPTVRGTPMTGADLFAALVHGARRVSTKALRKIRG